MISYSNAKKAYIYQISKKEKNERTFLGGIPINESFRSNDN